MVLGASPNPTRYSNIAAQRLQNKGHDTVLVGVRAGEIGDKIILLGQPVFKRKFFLTTTFI